MIFYEIEILSVPKLAFACSVYLEKYKNQFIYRKDFLEISVCEEGRISFEHDNGEKEIVYPGMLMPILSDISCKTSSYKDEKQRHTTVGVNLKYNLKRYNSENECDIFKLKERMKNNCIILIPYHCNIDDKYNKITKLLKKIITLNSSENPSDYLNAIAEWYALVSLLTNFVLTKLEAKQLEIPPSELIYVKKATQYININYMYKLTVKEISEHLGISEGYLHRIFKRTNGVSVLEYINQLRITNAITLILNKNTSLKEAALCVGIDDPAYMSRLFKKITGLSYRDYFNQKREDGYSLGTGQFLL